MRKEKGEKGEVYEREEKTKFYLICCPHNRSDAFKNISNRNKLNFNIVF